MKIDFSSIPMEPRHKLYAFGDLPVGGQVVAVASYGDTLQKVRNHVIAHAQYTGKNIEQKRLMTALLRYNALHEQQKTRL